MLGLRGPELQLRQKWWKGGVSTPPKKTPREARSFARVHPQHVLSSDYKFK